MHDLVADGSQFVVATHAPMLMAYPGGRIYALDADSQEVHGFRVEADFSGDKLGAKIRNARTARHPYMLIVGPKDAEGGTVSVRSRDRGELGALKFDEFAEMLAAESKLPL